MIASLTLHDFQIKVLLNERTEKCKAINCTYKLI